MTDAQTGPAAHGTRQDEQHPRTAPHGDRHSGAPTVAGNDRPSSAAAPRQPATDGSDSPLVAGPAGHEAARQGSGADTGEEPATTEDDDTGTHRGTTRPDARRTDAGPHTDAGPRSEGSAGAEGTARTEGAQPRPPSSDGSDSPLVAGPAGHEAAQQGSRARTAGDPRTDDGFRDPRGDGTDRADDGSRADGARRRSPADDGSDSPLVAGPAGHEAAAQGDGARTRGDATRAGADGTGDGDPQGELLPHEECDSFAARLQQVIAEFVDGPRDAVEEADHVMEEVAARVTQALDDRRRTLRAAWQADSGATDAGDTEQLRLALRDYRELTDRLLHI